MPSMTQFCVVLYCISCKHAFAILILFYITENSRRVNPFVYEPYRESRRPNLYFLIPYRILFSSSFPSLSNIEVIAVPIKQFIRA